MPVVDVDRLKEQGRRFVDGFTPGQKAMTILGVIAVVLAGTFFMKWAATPDYIPLYSGLSSADAGAVTQQLDSTGVKYKIAGGGGTILVSKQDVYKTRIALSAKGIPSGAGSDDGSFVKFDNQSITTDQFTRNVNYQRALQSELARTIESIDSVSAATVTLTIPQQTVFVGADQDKATAAVLVKTNGDGELPNETVNAIVNLVASSVPNMKTDDVTVADANGNVLHTPGMDINQGGGDTHQQQQTVEATIQKKVGDMIAQTLGPGHAAVTVAADLDPSKHQTTTQTYTNPTPNNGAPPAIQQNNDSTQFTGPGTARAANGQLGLNGTAGTAAGASGANSFTENKTQQNNAINSQQDTSTTPAGTIKKLSVSVLLDSNVVATPADVTSKWIPAITAAAGIQPTRDGQNALQVTTVAFDKTAAKAAQAQLNASAGNPLFDLIKHFLTLLMIAIVLFFAWRAIKKAETNRVPLRVPLDLRELEAAPALNALEPATAGGGGARAGTPAHALLEAAPPTIEGEITDLIERQPEEVAQTLRSWLADRRT